jgi:hypothetical protein
MTEPYPETETQDPDATEPPDHDDDDLEPEDKVP